MPREPRASVAGAAVGVPFLVLHLTGSCSTLHRSAAGASRLIAIARPARRSTRGTGPYVRPSLGPSGRRVTLQPRQPGPAPRSTSRARAAITTDPGVNHRPRTTSNRLGPHPANPGGRRQAIGSGRSNSTGKGADICRPPLSRAPGMGLSASQDPSEDHPHITHVRVGRSRDATRTHFCRSERLRHTERSDLRASIHDRRGAANPPRTADLARRASVWLVAIGHQMMVFGGFPVARSRRRTEGAAPVSRRTVRAMCA
jgi:hypothetical protein